MYIVNEHGIIHSIEDGPLPAGARAATANEAEYYEAPGSDCVAANTPKPKKAKEDAKPTA